MKDIELPPLATSDHPDYPAMAWLPMELSAIYRYARAAVEADRAQRVPDGWKIVPIEPTVEMLVVGMSPQTDGEKYLAEMAAGYRKEIWSAMISASPNGIK